MLGLNYDGIENYLKSYGKYIVRQARGILKQRGKDDTGKLSKSLKFKILSESSWNVFKRSIPPTTNAPKTNHSTLKSNNNTINRPKTTSGKENLMKLHIAFLLMC